MTVYNLVSIFLLTSGSFHLTSEAFGFFAYVYFEEIHPLSLRNSAELFFFLQSNLLASGANDSEIFIWDLNNFSVPMTPGAKSQVNKFSSGHNPSSFISQ